MKITSKFIRYSMLSSLGFFVSMFIWFIMTINSFRNSIIEELVKNPNEILQFLVSFETAIWVVLTSFLVLLFTASFSWFTLAYSTVRSTEKYFITTAEGLCDELIKLIISYENDNAIAKQKIFAHSDLFSELLKDNSLNDKKISENWQKINSDIGRGTSNNPKQLDQAMENLIKLRMMITKTMMP